MYAEINFIAFNCEEYYDIAIEVKVMSNTESLNIGKKRGSLTIYIVTVQVLVKHLRCFQMPLNYFKVTLILK